MRISRRQIIQSTGAAILVASIDRSALAQSGGTTRIITGFAPGGTADTICRRVAERLRSAGHVKNAVVENKTGAGGQVAIQFMKSQPADGSAILQTPMSMLGVYPHIYKKLPYDPLDVTPVSLGAVLDLAFAVGPAVPSTVKTIPEFLVWCKANPTQTNFGSPGAGSLPHFLGVLIGRSAGVDLNHAAFRGTQPAILDMMGGQISAVSGPVGEFTQHIPSGKCRLLGTSGAQRSRFAPNVATFTEQGLKDMVFTEWFGFYLPTGATVDVILRTNAALRSALAAPEVVNGLAAMGLEAASSTPAELAAMLKADTERWGPIVKAIGFTAEA